MFGDGIKPTVIMPEYFAPPDFPSKVEIEDEVQPVPEKPAPKKKPVPVVEKPTPAPPPPPKKVETKPEPPTPVVDAKIIETFIPKNVQFEKGETIILKSSYTELNRFVDFMLRHSELSVMIEGHTDVVGDAALNLQLSKDRAEKISDFLVEKGIDEQRISWEGYGGTRPLGIPEPDGYYPANRRVVFIVDGY